MQPKTRITWPDIAKGITIILVVFYHSIIPKLRQDYIGYFFIHAAIKTVVMPLFFFASGWLFELSRSKGKKISKSQNIGSKFMRLMVPYFTFSVLNYIIINVALNIKQLAPMFSMSNGGYEKSTIPSAVFQILTFEGSMAKSLWFLYSLFIVMVFNILMPKIMKHPVTVCALFFLPYLLMVIPNFDLLIHVFIYCFYFSLARCIFSYTDKILAMKKYIYAIISVLFLAGASIYSVCKYHDVFVPENPVAYAFKFPVEQTIAILGIIFICVGASYIGKTNNIANRIFSYTGKNSLVIYLIHAPILTQAIVSLTIKVAPFVPSLIVCLIGTVVGVVLPLIVSKYILTKVPILNTLFLGAPFKRKKK